jgi:hypothetical protein
MQSIMHAASSAQACSGHSKARTECNQSCNLQVICKQSCKPPALAKHSAAIGAKGATRLHHTGASGCLPPREGAQNDLMNMSPSSLPMLGTPNLICQQQVVRSQSYHVTVFQPVRIPSYCLFNPFSGPLPHLPARSGWNKGSYLLAHRSA